MKRSSLWGRDRSTTFRRSPATGRTSSPTGGSCRVARPRNLILAGPTLASPLPRTAARLESNSGHVGASLYGPPVVDDAVPEGTELVWLQADQLLEAQI